MLRSSCGLNSIVKQKKHFPSSNIRWCNGIQQRKYNLFKWKHEQRQHYPAICLIAKSTRRRELHSLAYRFKRPTLLTSVWSAIVLWELRADHCSHNKVRSVRENKRNKTVKRTANDSDAAYKYNEISCYNGSTVIAFLNQDLYFIIRCLQQVRRKVPRLFSASGSSILVGKCRNDGTGLVRESSRSGRICRYLPVDQSTVTYLFHHELYMLHHKSHIQFRIMFYRFKIKSCNPQK